MASTNKTKYEVYGNDQEGWAVVKEGTGHTQSYWDTEEEAEEQADRLNAEMNATATIRLGDLGTGHVWFASVGHPAGCDLVAEQGEPLSLPGDSLGGDLSDWWDLTGAVAGGNWRWDGEGNPRDFRGNTVTRIVAFTSK